MKQAYTETKSISLSQIQDLQKQVDRLPQGAQRAGLVAQIKALGVEVGQMNATDQAKTTTDKGFLAGIRGLLGH